MIVGAGPVRNYDTVGLGMFASCEIRVHPTGSVIARLDTKSQGQGHETTFAQIIATELGIPSDNIIVEEGDTDTAPYGLCTCGSRSTPVAGAATARAARKIRDKAKKIAAHVPEVSEQDLEWEVDRFTGDIKVRRFHALDDCGTRINPMVIDGQIHGGLAEAYGIAMGQEILYDEAETSSARACSTISCPARSLMPSRISA